MKIVKGGNASKNHYVFCMDVSGSMYGSLRQIREELKNKLSQILKPTDLLTIIWFSGRNDAGYVFKQLSVANAKDLKEVHDGIDRWLQADCLTAFDKPIRLAGEAVLPDYSNSFIFCSDGANNDVSKDAVRKELNAIVGKFDNYSFIEYGTYCDSRFMAEMAQIVGGSQSVKEGVQSFIQEVETQLSIASEPRIEIEPTTGATHVIGFDGSTVIVYPVVDGKASVNASTVRAIAYASGKNTAHFTIMDLLITALGAAMLNNWAITEGCVTAIGDESLLNALGGAYGIQKIESFKSLLLEAIKGNVSLLPTEGATIDENAFCVFDLLELLTSTSGNYLYTDHEAFNYKRIGLAKVAKVSEDIKTSTEAASFFGIDAPVKPIEFIKIADQATRLDKLTLNTERANVSLLASYKGTVVNIPENSFGIKEFDTMIHRNYTIIQDGRLNVTKLPVLLSKEFFGELPLDAANKIFDGESALDEINVLDLSQLPIINRRRIKELNAVESVQTAFELLKIRAALKVVKTLRPDTYNQVEGQSPEVAEFLKSIGITNQGYSPKVESAESKDFYFAPELTFNFAGASALPSVSKVIEKAEKIVQWAQTPKGKEPKLNLGEALISQAMQLCQSLSEEKAVEYAAKINAQKRSLERKLAGITSTLILSRGWFADKVDFEDNKVTLQVPKLGEIDCNIKFTDIEVKI